MARAVRIHEIGGPEVLKLENVEVADPGPGQARVRHSYVAVNFIDIYFRTGRYPLPMPNGLGSDAVGVVEAVERGLQGVLADRVVHHRHALAVGELAHPLGDVLARGHDGVLSLIHI